MTGLGRGGGGRGRGGFRHHGGGFRHRGGGWRRGGWRGPGWVGYWGGWGPGWIDYYSYGPCDQCWGQPPSLYLECLKQFGCPIPPALGQESTATPTSTAALAVVGGALVVGVGLWLNSRRK